VAALSPAGSGDDRPLICHVVYRFAVGGLENGVVNLINHLPRDRWRHAVVSLTEIDPGFAGRIQVPDVALRALHKPPGQGYRQWPLLVRTFRELAPAIVHTRNLGALEAQVPAAWCGVPGRVHGEHGWDAADPDGRNWRHRWTRRLYRPFVKEAIALGAELTRYARERVGMPAAHLHTIYNGVDTQRFVPRGAERGALPGLPFTGPGLWLAGTVGRMQTVKAQPVLARAFVQALALAPALRSRLRLVMVGDGSLREECRAILDAAGVADLAWLPGERADVPDVMRALDCFVLPSLAEGISNTILEAMASGLPVLATRVGANGELVDEGVSGCLVPAGDPQALARALVELANRPEDATAMGQAGRMRVEQRFSLHSMVAAYDQVYRRTVASALQE
jgi:sugar transferase (PEP-CTERM/EpsH1 system associated)